MLVGTMPTELGLLSNLECFSLSITSISGTIPSELGRFQSPNFREFGLNNMRLTGTIPTEIFALRAEGFWLQKNMLEGTIPTEIGLATNASEFAVVENTCAFVSLVAHVISLCNSRVEIMSVWENMLTGLVPSEIGQLALAGTLSQ